MSSASQGRPSGGMASGGVSGVFRAGNGIPADPGAGRSALRVGRGRVPVRIYARPYYCARTLARWRSPARSRRATHAVATHNDPHVVLLDARIVARRVSPRRRRETPMRGGGVTPRYARGEIYRCPPSLARRRLARERSHSLRSHSRPPKPPEAGGLYGDSPSGRRFTQRHGNGPPRCEDGRARMSMPPQALARSWAVLVRLRAGCGFPRTQARREDGQALEEFPEFPDAIPGIFSPPKKKAAENIPQRFLHPSIKAVAKTAPGFRSRFPALRRR